VSGVAVYYDHGARCFVGRDRHSGILSAGMTRQRAVMATVAAVAMVKRMVP
jgi:hypothetical protein